MKSRNLYIYPLIVVLCVIFGYGIGLWRAQVSAQFPVQITHEQKLKVETQIKDAKKNVADTTSVVDAFPYLMDIGVYYEALGDGYHAAGAYRAATRARPGAIAPWMSLGYLAEKEENWKEAAQNFSKVLEHDDKNLQAYLEVIHIRRDHLHASQPVVSSLYEEAAKRTGDDPELHRDFARFLERINNREAAIGHWRAVNGRLHDDVEAKERIDALSR